MIEKETCRSVGEIVKTHGIQGEMTLRLFDGLTIDCIDEEFLFLDIDGGLVPFLLEEAREKNQNDVLIKLEGLSDEKKAARYINSPVYVPGVDEEESESEQFSTYQLIGYKAYDITLGELGEITGILDISKNPLFEVKKGEKELLIPITDDFIQGLDDKKREILFDLPQGLIDMD